jgi:cytochrome c-type biogenesis protein CcmH
VLEEVDEPAARSPAPADGRWVAGIVGAAIPLAAAVLYFQIGNPDAMSPGATSAGHGGSGATAQQVEEMVGRLAARLQAQPDDPEGWYLLGRSYYVMGRFAESAAAYERAVKLRVEEPGLFADYADALAMSQDRKLDEGSLPWSIAPSSSIPNIPRR